MNILVTAGPTREKIDPVRFISNYSTGTFGYEVAREAARRGHKVVLVSGPTTLAAPRGVKIVRVESASEMRVAVKKVAARCDCVIMAAAVSDWRARFKEQRKIKRGKSKKVLELVENPDILAELGKHKRGILVGFALETEALAKNAAKKLKKKNLDLIIANRLTRGAQIFGGGRTDVLMLDRSGAGQWCRKKTKKELAKIILDKVSNFNI